MPPDHPQVTTRIDQGMSNYDILSRINQIDRLNLQHKIIHLLDTQMENTYGGTGETFNWQIARKFSEYLPIMVAGGLNPDNVAELIKQVRPWGVDVSSGVECNGIKDVHKIKAFIDSVKNTNQGA